MQQLHMHSTAFVCMCLHVPWAAASLCCPQAAAGAPGDMPDLAPHLPVTQAPGSPDASTFRPGWEV